MPTLPDVIEDYIAAYNRKDVEAMMACLGPEISFRNISGGTVTAEASDRQAFETMARAGVSIFQTRRQRVTTAITVDDTTLARIDYTAVVAMDLPNGWTAGQELALSGASLFRLRDGRIVAIVDES